MSYDFSTPPGSQVMFSTIAVGQADQPSPLCVVMPMADRRPDESYACTTCRPDGYVNVSMLPFGVKVRSSTWFSPRAAPASCTCRPTRRQG